MWFINWIKIWNEKRLFRRALKNMDLKEILTPPENPPEWWKDVVGYEVLRNRRPTIDDLGRLAVSQLPCAEGALGLLVGILTHDYHYVKHPKDRRGVPTSWVAYRSEVLVDLIIALGYNSTWSIAMLSVASDRLPHYQMERLYTDLNEQLARRLPMRLQELFFACFVYDPRDDGSNPWE